VTDGSIVRTDGAGRTAVRGLFGILSTAGFVGGIAQIVVEGSKPAPPKIRALAALGFLVSGVVDGIRTWQRLRPANRSRSKVVTVNLGLILAFDRATPNYHHPRPLWLTAFAIVILVGVMVSIALGVYLWRRSEDERDRAIANGSMAVAFLATLALVVFFALLQSTGVGPTLQPSYVLLTAVGSFFAAFYVLRRRM